jgi:hypothetical protein
MIRWWEKRAPQLVEVYTKQTENILTRIDSTRLLAFHNQLGKLALNGLVVQTWV